jgi:hypothetical protein
VNRRLASGFAFLLLAAWALLTPVTSAAAAPADDVFSLVNQGRSANGQNALVRNGALDQVAAAWGQQLAASGVPAHNPHYSTQIPAGWSHAGENVAWGQVDANQMHNEWMASPGHRANILGDYTDVGIVFLNAGGTTWGVQVFANYPAAAAATPPLPAPVAATASEAPPEAENLPTFALTKPAEPPPTDPSAKATAQSDGPFGGAQLEQPLRSPLVLFAGGLLVAVAAVSTVVRRRHLLER